MIRWEYHCPAPGCIACGSHEAATLWQLMREVIAHRWWHWRRGDGWID